jgi:DNA replication protein DnaC
MLNHPTLDKLQQLKCLGMATALTEQMACADFDTFTFDERLGLLVDRELTYRDNRRMSSRLRRARLRHNACLEDIDYRTPRGLDRSLLTSMATCREHLNVLITGPTGVGKSWLACALAHQACREGYSVLYLRLPRLFTDLAIARGDGRYAKQLAALTKVDLLLIDDWGLTVLNTDQQRDLLEVLEDRYQTRSTLVTSQLPVEKWHGCIADPTFADAILDRLVHNAHRLVLNGDSIRKTDAKRAGLDVKAQS